tara:strand:- start:325 stop:651 length:327 start_codon:yes stop_codon:yes gene_type:complete
VLFLKLSLRRVLLTWETENKKERIIEEDKIKHNEVGKQRRKKVICARDEKQFVEKRLYLEFGEELFIELLFLCKNLLLFSFFPLSFPPLSFINPKTSSVKIRLLLAIN